MERETFIIRDKEFTCIPMMPFEANKILLRIQKIFLPAIGSFLSSKDLQNVFDMELESAAVMLAKNIDENIMADIIFPMFSACQLFCTTDNVKLDNPTKINQVFTTKNLMDFYELIWLVFKYQFGPFFESLMSLIGNLKKEVPVQNSPEN